MLTDIKMKKKLGTKGLLRNHHKLQFVSLFWLKQMRIRLTRTMRNQKKKQKKKRRMVNKYQGRLRQMQITRRRRTTRGNRTRNEDGNI